LAYWRSQARNAASGSSGVVEAGSCRWVARCRRPRGRRTARWPPAPAGDDERLPAGVPGLEVSLRGLLEVGLLQLGIGQQPFEGGVLTLEIPEPFGVFGFQPAGLVTPPVIRRFADTQLGHTATVSLPSASSDRPPSACAQSARRCAASSSPRSLLSLPAHVVGRKTLISRGSTDRGHGKVTGDVQQHHAAGIREPATPSRRWGDAPLRRRAIRDADQDQCRALAQSRWKNRRTDSV
jgi:hypothetical protein